MSNGDETLNVDFIQQPNIYSTSDNEVELAGDFASTQGKSTETIKLLPLPGQSEKKPASKRWLIALTCISAIGGALFGYDTGVVSGAMILIDDRFHLNHFWHELLVSVTVAAAAVSALASGILNDWLGRKGVMLLAAVVFTIGAVVMGISSSKEVLLVGRVIVGFGIG